MNKQELVTAIAEKTELSKKDAEGALKAFIDTVTEELVKGEKVQLVGFMSFESTNIPERECRNPKDGTHITVPQHRKVKVKIGKQLKESVR